MEQEGRRCGKGVGGLWSTCGDTEETLGGGEGGGCWFSRSGGGGSGRLRATTSPWSLSTTSASRKSAWAFSSTLSFIISDAAAICWPRWRTS